MSDLVRVYSAKGDKPKVSFRGVDLPHVKAVEWDSDWVGKPKVVVEFEAARIDIRIPVDGAQARTREGSKFGFSQLRDLLWGGKL